MKVWKQFYDSPRDTQTHDGPPPSVEERAKDEIYANAVNALAAVMRFDIEEQRVRGGSPHAQMTQVLRTIALQLIDNWSPDALPVRDVFDTHGPGAVLLALKRAYELPQPCGELEGD